MKPPPTMPTRIVIALASCPIARRTAAPALAAGSTPPSYQASLARRRLRCLQRIRPSLPVDRAFPGEMKHRRHGRDGGRIRAFAKCLLAADPPDLQGAEEAIRNAIAIQESYGTRIELAWSLTVQSTMGAAATARESLARAAELLEAMGIERDLAGVRRTVAELECRPLKKIV
jgi:hypothetical protein